MNAEQIKGIVERLLTILVTYAVSKGWVTTADAAPLVAGGVAAASVAWGLYVNTHASLSTAAEKVK